MKVLSNRSKAVALLVIVSFFYAAMGVVSRWLNLGFQPFTQVYLRLFGALVISIVVFSKNLRVKKLKSIPTNDLCALLLMGIIGYGFFVYFITLGALHAPLLSVSVVLATAPFFSYLLSWIFLGKKLNLLTVIFLFVSLFGVGVVASNSFIFFPFHFGQGELFVLIAAFCLAFFSVGRKLISKHLNNREITVVVIFFAFLTTITMAIVNREPLPLSGFLLLPVIVGLFLGSIINVLTTLMENFSFEHLPPVLGNQITLLENLFAPLLGYFLYQEKLTIYQLIGAVVIIGSVYLNNKTTSSN